MTSYGTESLLIAQINPAELLYAQCDLSKRDELSFTNLFVPTTKTKTMAHHHLPVERAKPMTNGPIREHKNLPNPKQ